MSEREAPFTVAQLIDALQQLPGDMRVMTRGYEGGFHDATAPEVTGIKLNVNSSWYYGPHDTPNSHAGETADIEAAIL